LGKLKYNIFGSEDSTDLDIMFFLDNLPDTVEESKSLCKILDSYYLAEKEIKDREVNSNIAVVKVGSINQCFKGTVDEVNNMILQTYSFHKQDHPLQVSIPMKRNIPVKIYRSLRIMLTFLSRTSYRSSVKAALKSSSLFGKVSVLKAVPFDVVVKEGLEKVTPIEFAKVSAFQIGQCLGLLNGVELYTKNQISYYYRALAPALRRDERVEESIKMVEMEKDILLENICDLLCKGTYNIEQFKEN